MNARVLRMAICSKMEYVKGRCVVIIWNPNFVNALYLSLLDPFFSLLSRPCEWNHFSCDAWNNSPPSGCIIKNYRFIYENYRHTIRMPGAPFWNFIHSTTISIHIEPDIWGTPGVRRWHPWAWWLNKYILHQSILLQVQKGILKCGM